jgi:hypothetical protein
LWKTGILSGRITPYPEMWLPLVVLKSRSRR